MARLSMNCLFLAATGSTLMLFAQAPVKKSAAEMEASYKKHHGDFDYLLGDWEFTTVSKEYGKGRGFWSAVRLSTGQILDEFRIVGDAGETYYVTTTLRAYNAATERWELVGMNPGSGLQDVGTGQRTGNEVRIEQKFGVTGQRPTALRIHYFNIQPDRFSWTADRSADDGKTWSKDDQQIEAHRIGPPRELGALAPARNTAGK